MSKKRATKKKKFFDLFLLLTRGRNTFIADLQALEAKQGVVAVDIPLDVFE